MKKNKKEKLRVALFHPWIKSRGGAEKVVLELLKKSRHDVDLYTWVYDPASTFDEFSQFKVRVLAPKFSRRLSRLHTSRGFLLPLGLMRKIPLDRYDKFLISTAGMAELITFRNRKPDHTYAYVHTPLREADDKIIAWNLDNRYKRTFLRKYFYLFAVQVYRFLERRAWRKLDAVMFNSSFSMKRAEKRKLLDDQVKHVVYPPIEVERLRRPKPKRGKSKQSKHFVYFSRINPPKRQDVLIDAWKRFVKKHPGYTLTIVGTPENKSYTEKIIRSVNAVPSITLKTHASDKDLSVILNDAFAGIFLGYQEDAGIIPLEIIGLHKPLLAVDEGGYVDLVRDHELFVPIKEKHDRKKMVSEVNKELSLFIKKYKKPKKTKRLKKKNFIKEIDNILEK